MVKATDNGKSLDWFSNPGALLKGVKDEHMLMSKQDNSGLEATPALNQLKILLRRGYIQAKRDSVSNKFLAKLKNATFSYFVSF